MDNRLLIIMFSGCIAGSAYAQQAMGVSKDPSFRPDTRTVLHVKQDNYAVRLPRVNSVTAVPVSQLGTENLGTQGSIVFDKATGSIIQNDGLRWKVSDSIVLTRKQGKVARFVQNSNTVLDFGNCGSTVLTPICGLENKQATPAYVVFTNNINDMSNAVSLDGTTSSVIQFKETGLYRISYKSGEINMKVPRTCADVGNTWYARTDLEKKLASQTSWLPIANNTNSKSIGALSLTDMLPLGIDPGVSNSITHTGVFNQGDAIRIKFYGNLNMVTGGCTMAWSTLIGQGRDMKYTLDATGGAATEIIIEKINF